MHPARPEFHLLDKALSFDDAQEAPYRLPPPLIIVGCAGSGKTALTLEKLKHAAGDVLYVTLSRLPRRSTPATSTTPTATSPSGRNADFLAYREFVETIHVPPGRAVALTAISAASSRHRQQRAGVR